MPVRSKKQWKWMRVNAPEMLRKWQGESPVDFKALPNRVKAKVKRKKHG